MKSYQILFICFAVLAFSACSNVKSDSKNSAPPPKKVIEMPVASLAAGTDLVCGMPLTKGEIGDTAMYQGKVYGFCGKGCKDEFVKAPNQYLSQ